MRTCIPLCLAAIAIAGCSKPAPAPPDPRKVLADMLQAVESANKIDFMDNVYFGNADSESATALFDLMVSVGALTRDMETAYSAERLPPYVLNTPLVRPDQIYRAKLAIRDGRTVVLVDDKEFAMIRRGERWLVDFSADVPPDAATRAMTQAMIRALGEARAKVGKSGYDPDRIGRELADSLRHAAACAPASAPAP